MSDELVPAWRVVVLRATFALVAVGLGAMIGPGLVHHDASWPHLRGVVHAMLGGVMILAAVGVARPLAMLPLLLFELAWKVLWLLAFALPLWMQDAMTPATRASVADCLVGLVILPAAIPWGYVRRRFAR